MSDDRDELETDEGDEASSRGRSKAERLEAKAAKLRIREEARKQAAGEASETGALPDGLSPRTSRIWTVVAGVLALLLIAVVVLVVHERAAAHTARRNLAATRQLEAARSSALTAAEQYAVDFGSYSYLHLNADFATVTAHLTPSFAQSYKSTSASLAPAIKKYKGVSVATVQGAGITSATTTTATVVVFLDQTVTSQSTRTPQVDRNRLELQLVRQKGQWMINDLLLK